MMTDDKKGDAGPATIWIRWSDDGQNIRKWDRKPFDGGIPWTPAEPRAQPSDQADASARRSLDIELVAWEWLRTKAPEPTDQDWTADQMIDAFMAGASRLYRPAPDKAPQLQSIEAEARQWIAGRWDGADHSSFHFADMVLAFSSGAALALGPLARALIGRTWVEACGLPLPDVGNPSDSILGEIVGDIGPALAWPIMSDIPTLADVAELVLWIVSDAAATESAWRKGGIADQKPEEFAFLLEVLGKHRAAAAYMRRLSQEILRLQRERFEWGEAARRGLNDIRATTGQDSSARMRERAGQLLGQLGIEFPQALEPWAQHRR